MAKRQKEGNSSQRTNLSPIELKAKSLFGQYDAEVMYATSDNSFFFSEDTAKVHAATLMDKTIKTIKRQ